MIRLIQVEKQYPKGSRLNALHRVDLSVDKGEFLFLTGASGAGKSTLLRLISMEEFPTHGEVIVDYHSSTTITRQELPRLRQKIGVVFQDFRLWRDWTIAENVGAAIRVTGEFGPRELRQRTQQALQKVGLAHRGQHYPSELSGGEQQRVAIARAIVNTPLVLLADEPTGNLDEENAEVVLKHLADFAAEGGAVLLVTHDSRAADKAQRILHLEQGSPA